MTLDNVSAILITAGLKSELRTEILKNNFIKTNNPVNEINN
jgi:hypothetical protein